MPKNAIPKKVAALGRITSMARHAPDLEASVDARHGGTVAGRLS
jgi:hypothetical protein